MDEETAQGDWIGNLKEWCGKGGVELSRMAKDRVVGKELFMIG